MIVCESDVCIVVVECVGVKLCVGVMCMLKSVVVVTKWLLCIYGAARRGANVGDVLD